ncbi:glycosyltransferase family 4 protein [Bradyrhizobium sp. HKCCYLR20261]|uniref:glycosyltransferase family 4 protein n=1 Tax=Bradyrhizobium sp. HKCCYLR20261 TaxID=3420760 RepID=UPI003EC156A0
MEAVAAGRRAAVLAVAHQFALGFGGVPESILLLARELRAVGITIDVLSKDGFIRDVGRLSSLPPRGGGLAFDVIRGLDLADYRAVFVAGAWNPVALMIAVRARRRSIRVIYSPKGNLARAEFKRPRDVKKFPYLATAELALMTLAARIIYSSVLEQQHSLLSPLFAAKATVIAEPFLGPDLTGSRPSPSKTLRFGFMAEIAPRKGLAELVEAFVTWQRKDGPDAELHIAGEPRPASENYLQGIRRVSEEEVKRGRIVWRGPLRGAARDRFYDEIDFFVCPTRFESFGLTPLEALWHGTPVIVTENLGVLEFISDANCMLRVGTGSPSEILAGLKLAMRGRDAYVTAASGWRSRPCPRLSGRDLAAVFAQEFGFGP